MEVENKVINGLWIGFELSNLELLTIHSFVNQGHEFHLWAYNSFNEQLPEGAILENANDIIPEDEVFRYKNATKSGIGKDSVAGFSDIFRYKLLYEVGGWWVDMDVTCLKAFDISQPYLFPKDNSFPLTGKILKSPINSALMLDCYNESIKIIDENNTDWGKPIHILINNVKKYNLQAYAIDNFINYDSFVYVDLYRHFKVKMPSELYSFHWSHELWRSYRIDKSKYRIDSTYGQLLLSNSVISKERPDTWETRHSIIKYLQLKLFRFLYTHPSLWFFLKKLKGRLSTKYDLWIP